MNQLLGVSIPTYKRPDQLRRCLASVIEAARPYGVPIYVLDDSGDDTNLQTMADMQRSYEGIHHVRNAVNLGIDRNILCSVDTCDSRYVWLLGEDDRLIPESIGEMLEVLAGNPDFVFANYSTVNEDVSVVLKEQALPLDVDATLSAADFLSRHGWAAGFIGGCVVNKKRWNSVQQASYIGTYFAHVGVIFHSIQGRSIYQVAKPLVLNRCGTADTFTWQPMAFEVLGGWARLMKLLRPLYGEAVCEQSLATFEGAHGLNSLKFLLYARAGGAYGEEQYRAFIRPGQGGCIYKAAAWLVARTKRTWIQRAHGLLSKARQQRGRRLNGY